MEYIPFIIEILDLLEPIFWGAFCIKNGTAARRRNILLVRQLLLYCVYVMQTIIIEIFKSLEKMQC